MTKNILKLEQLLISSGKITESQLEKALSIQRKTGKKINEILIEKDFITEDEIIKVLELHLGIPYIDLDNYQINPEVATLIPENIVKRHELIAVDRKDNILVIAMVDPLNIFALDDVKFHVKMDVQPVISNREKLLRAIDRFYSSKIAKKAIEEFQETYENFHSSIIEKHELIEVVSAPVVKLLNSIIEQAVREGASDIHIEPNAEDIRVRFRIDGDLKDIMNLSKSSHSAIITRIKIMGKMNIAEKRLPQDGRVELKVAGRDIDMRISTLPTVYGEKAVIRLLDRMRFLIKKESLGFTEEDLNTIKKIISQPYGMFLITGPTGSGKTTTLYSILQELNCTEKNIVTIEDPVEYKLKGINQVQVNVKPGLTFALGLRSILRQDPDIIMVGEIRDNETAEIAVRAAITGHLVLSTLHTNDCPSTVIRLIDMGIEPYLVSSAIIGVLSQRLVKLLCPKCKKPYVAGDMEKQVLGVEKDKELILYKPTGCSFCNGGYRGRTAAYELMPVTENIRRLINKNANTDEIRKKAIEDGMKTLIQSASRLALEGKTSIEEVLRVGYTLG